MSSSLLQSLIEERSCTHCVLKPMCRPAIVRPDDVETLAGAVLPRRQVPVGARVYEQGSPIRALYVSQGGVLKTETLNADGQFQVIGFHFPGELMGLEAMAGGHFRASAVAVEPAMVCEIPLDALERVASRDPDFQRQLLRAAGTCLAHQQDHLELLALRQADERLALFLVGLLERSEAVSGRSEDVIHLPMGRSDLGNYLCLTIETISRAFSRLRDAHILDVNGRHLRILNRASLIERSKVSPEELSRKA